MSDLDNLECGMCGDPIEPLGDWCGNTDCPLGPDEDDGEESTEDDVDPADLESVDADE